MNLQQVWYDNTRRRQWQQKKWRGKIYKVLQAQTKTAAAAFADRSTGPMANFDTIIKASDIGGVLYRLAIDVGVREANSSYSELRQQTKRASLGFDKEFAQAIIDYLQKYFLITVNNINEYTKELILNVITQGVQEGLGQDVIVQNILGLNVINSRRANTIVRTEVNRAANAGRHIGAKKTGLLLKKIWSSANQPARTRGGDPKDKADHLHMNAQKVDMDEQFTDPRNGAKLDVPGDPNAPIENTINCRCAVAYEPQKDALGNYIRVEKPLYENVFN